MTLYLDALYALMPRCLSLFPLLALMPCCLVAFPYLCPAWSFITPSGVMIKGESGDFYSPAPASLTRKYC